MSGSVATPRLSVVIKTLSTLAHKDASERIRALIKRQVTVSKRQGIWFRLDQQERAIVNLALSLKVSFKSSELMRAIVSIMKRLQEVGSRSFELVLRGSRLATSFSEAAVSWGYAAASSWRSDMAFITFLGRFCVPNGSGKIQRA
jgi:hypothetical protein